MTAKIDSIINSDNYCIISNCAKGQWLEDEGAGKLHYVDGFVQKSWYVVRDLFSWGGVHSRTARTINSVCQKFFSEICANCQAPIRSNSPILNRYRDTIAKLARSVKRMSSRVCDQKIAQNIVHLKRCPEIVEATLALDQGIRPAPLAEGISGTYLLHDRRRNPWAIFKPVEQEPGGPSNPKGFSDMRGFLRKIHIESGTNYLRERAAYLLDRSHFSSVPLTAIASLPRIAFGGGAGLTKGSFQMFVPNCKHAWDHYQILPWFLSFARGHKIPPHEIHKIAILDIRTLNCDRHLKNFLVVPGGAPIRSITATHFRAMPPICVSTG